MPTVELEANKISSLPDFHAESARAFGFPDFYGGNLSAWIDCLSGLRDGDGMSAFRLGPDERLEIVLRHAARLRRTAPEVLAALRQGVREVNLRLAENGEKPVLDLVLR